MCLFRGEGNQDASLSSSEAPPTSESMLEESPSLNADGFGVGWYHKRGGAIFRSVTAAWNNSNLRELSESIESRCIFAHVRRLLFQHNGHVEGFDRIKRRVFAAMRDDVYHWVQGTTDSEACFALILSLIEPELLAGGECVPVAAADEIASLASGPLNLDGQKKIVKTLLANKCAAGPLFLLRKLSAMDSQHPFSLVRQLKVGDGKGTGGMIIQQLCNDALSTKGGTARHWGELISAADATKFIKGNLECVKSASGFDFWELLAPSISKQDGILAVSNASTGKTGDSRWVFLNARPLELMLTPLWDLFKLLGYSKTSTGCFYATFKNVISRTKVIGDLPPEDARTEGVKKLHVEACTEIFLCFANEYRAMLDLQLSVAVANGRPSTFYNASSTAGQLWAKVAATLCNECGVEADNGAIDPSDGMYYCATCWDAYSFLQARSAADANAARNQRDVATLRKIFPGHCAYHLYYHHVRGRTGCMRANCELLHERPDDLDAALTRLEWETAREE
ncbi:hypothetical protein EMIHUDRAFT_245079 [Emiliania huxleyi CCMP1516]|uniref:C3H1-type domain-containing protein n=2 Tax=Emiliania huxleyi TaxID=2903 RepID=A0A0D3IZ06_EMIH1|nr:hypothetical protein EMIHUDRAFT_245079 [Emiliania huxleyi CCMP1516]EOD16491.1 hypothetical protein EMIHUDRAFT_245079 [Emiliania huxleyi CCMP1516]|eukprot:XP_005768920.1 hypothetical protein EMIHUDRAFT_245079 [Emiliania huxleyi CCMP1516]